MSTHTHTGCYCWTVHQSTRGHSRERERERDKYEVLLLAAAVSSIRRVVTCTSTSCSFLFSGFAPLCSRIIPLHYTRYACTSRFLSLSHSQLCVFCVYILILFFFIILCGRRRRRERKKEKKERNERAYWMRTYIIMSRRLANRETSCSGVALLFYSIVAAAAAACCCWLLTGKQKHTIGIMNRKERKEKKRNYRNLRHNLMNRKWRVVTPPRLLFESLAVCLCCVIAPTHLNRTRFSKTHTTTRVTHSAVLSIARNQFLKRIISSSSYHPTRPPTTRRVFILENRPAVQHHWKLL